MNDILTTVKEINAKQKECLYILFANDMMAASTQRYDLDKFLASDEALVGPQDGDLDDVISIHGLVLDPAELPFEIPAEFIQDRHLWLIKNEGYGPQILSMDSYDSIQEITETIEEALEDGYISSIDEVAVVLAEDIGLCLNTAKTGRTLVASRVYGD